jgi:hypothetical protein
LQGQTARSLLLGSPTSTQTAREFAAKKGLLFEEVSAKTSRKLEKTVSEFALEIAREQSESVDLKEIYLNFLLGLNEDFDDDLLQEALELLVDL